MVFRASARRIPVRLQLSLWTATHLRQKQADGTRCRYRVRGFMPFYALTVRVKQ
jgi:hypothetical protein